MNLIDNRQIIKTFSYLTTEDIQTHTLAIQTIKSDIERATVNFANFHKILCQHKLLKKINIDVVINKKKMYNIGLHKRLGL